MDLYTMLNSPGDDIHYDPSFRVWVNSFIFKFKRNVRTVVVEDIEAYRYQGDLYGLFSNVLSIPIESHYLVALVNGYTNSVNYKGDRTIFLIPDTSLISTLITIYETTEKNNY